MEEKQKNLSENHLACFDLFLHYCLSLMLFSSQRETEFEWAILKDAGSLAEGVGVNN